ncbi:histidine ammonia-lyase [Plantibacter sp. MMLR14_011]|uniref:histidine ammonia-lyase n=1 Tax=Plantibacter sp. MMLR14_011 TaxID=1898746 RepID=UPI000A4D0FB7|nr:histidine ammonia-lyase [Plantibacter sp. MMLR14_011]
MSVIPDTDDSTRTAAVGVRVFDRNMDIQPGATPTTSDPTTSGRPHPEPVGPTSVSLGTGPLSIDEVVAVARHGARIDLDGEALDDVAASRRIIEALASDPEPHYGISTGFGALATTFIEPARRSQLQASLVRSHAAGSGDVVEREVVRSLMTLRLSTLMTGRTGVRVETVRAYAAMLNAGITPVVREYGSLGCSGDLAPLAHCALAVMGEGEVTDSHGRRRPAADALADAGLVPAQLAEKEGLALINGTDGMLGMLALAVDDLRMLLRTADVAAAMSVEGLLGTDAVFAADLQALRPQAGQAESAANLRLLLDGSPIVASHRGPECTRVQDAYSLRCTPQVHGAARDTVDHAATVAERELASAVDNPVLTPDGRVESNGNFHGAPVAYVLDFLAIAVADVASMSERRTDRFLDRSRSNGLPPFLAHEVGVDSGLMIAQYTAAGIVSELKRLAHPASVDSIPSSAMQEDHVSMGWAAARKLRRAIDGLSRVLAIEVMTAARGLDLRGPLEPAVGTGAVLRRVREQVTGPGPDRFLSPEIEAVTALVQSGGVVRAVTGAVGDLR